MNSKLEMEKNYEDVNFKESDERLNQMYLSLFKHIWRLEKEVAQANDELCKIIACQNENSLKKWILS